MLRIIFCIILSLILAYPATAGNVSTPAGVRQSGTITPGDCVSWLSNNFIQDSGSTCGGGGGGGTPGGSQYSIQYNAGSGNFGGLLATDGQLLFGQSSGAPAWKTVSGDFTFADTGVATLATVNGNVGSFQGLTVNAKGLVTGAVNENYLTGNQAITLSGDVSGSGATSISTTLATVNSNVGTFGNVTVNGKGLVTAATTALANGTTATTQAALDNSTQVATTAYTDSAVSTAVAGINPAVAVQAATTNAGNTSGLTYNNGASGVGATFVGSVNTALIIDGYTFTGTGQRLLVKNDTQSANPGAYNGIYYVTQIQTIALPPILTRALDYDQPSDINNTGAIPVINGTVNGSTTWVETAQVITVGITPLVYAQFSYNPANVVQTFSAGTTGLTPSSATSGGITLSGILSSSNGGAGSVNGALKGNGGGIVSQAACADLSNGATGCSTATGTSGSTIPLNNTVNTISATQTYSATPSQYLSGGAQEVAVFSNGNSGTSLSVNCDNGNVQSVTITGAVTIGLATPTHPCKFTLLIAQDGSGHVYSLSASIVWPAGTAPTWSTTASAKDAATIIYDGSTFWGEGNTAFATSR